MNVTPLTYNTRSAAQTVLLALGFRWYHPGEPGGAATVYYAPGGDPKRCAIFWNEARWSWHIGPVDDAGRPA
jgi:hypothetical protein